MQEKHIPGEALHGRGCGIPLAQEDLVLTAAIEKPRFSGQVSLGFPPLGWQ